MKTIAARLDDPRTPGNISYSVEYIIAISIGAIISGAEGPKSMARWANEKKDWLNGFLPDDVRSEHLLVIPIDCKTRRHSFDTVKAQRPLHSVSAWVAEFHISLGQIATEER